MTASDAQEGKSKEPAQADKPEKPEKNEEKGEEKPKKPKEPLKLRVKRWTVEHPIGAVSVVGGLVLVIIGALLLRSYLGSFEHTDDAQVDGHIAALSPRVAGTVQAVHVEENQLVKKGQLLVELDPRDYQVAVDRAEAQLGQAKANLEMQDPRFAITRRTQATQVATAADDVAAARAQVAGAERDLASARARVAQAEATATRAATDRKRAENLVNEDAISRQEFDSKVAESKAADAELRSARELANAAEKTVEQQKTRLASAGKKAEETEGNAPNEVSAQRAALDAAQAQVKAAQAELERARLDLEYARVLAPFDGIVGRRSAEAGQRVSPGQELIGVVDVSNLWVTANFKETQLDEIVPGQKADVGVDAYGAKYRGTVESIGAASGARFSLLPPENATGNYVKVVQRVPVRIRLDPDQPGLERLRPGMSVEPKVWLH